jgi:diadenosine tetraphosphate (Ap4A) HIT family hydrolase
MSFKLDPKLQNDCIILGSLTLCQVLLMNNSNYQWLILVPSLSDIVEITDLNKQQREILTEEINVVAEMLQQHFKPYKLNIAMLGNVVRQFHVHIVARNQGDETWPNPVWGRVTNVKPYDDGLKLIEILNNITDFKGNI